MPFRYPLTFVAVLMGILVSISVAQTNQSDAFYSAIRANDLPRLNALLTQGAGVNAKDTQGITPLMYAAWVGSADAMKVLLDRGADPNIANSSGSTALMMSVTELPKVQLLIARGANVNLASTRGRTALLLAAMSDRSSEIVRALIAAGADPKAADQGATTPLIAAAMGNDTETIRLLLASAGDVNTRNIPFGQTALIYAASNGNTAAVRLLLAKGADVNAVGGDGSFQQVKAGTIGIGKLTPLLMATPHGSAELVKTLLDAGANVTSRDVRGMTPLTLAVTADHADPLVIQALIDKGADVNAKDPAGETVLDWARKAGNTPAVAMLKRAGAVESPHAPSSVPAPAPADLRTSAQRSVALLEKTAIGAAANGGCAACHSHNITDVVSSLARAKGLQVDEKAAADRLALTRAPYFAPLNMLERFDAAGSPEVPLNAFYALAAADAKPDRVIDGMMANLVMFQTSEGRWLSPIGAVARPPMGDSDITRTALGIAALKRFGPPGRADMPERIDRAARWLASARAVTGDDRNMQLVGLKAAGAASGTLQRLAKAILATQRADGGWSQRDEMNSDAYATGQTLWALASAGMIQPRDAAFQKGVKYLLSTQHADGSWYVRSRAVKFQPYFESGFPYGGDQWISSMATGYGAAALAMALDEPKKLGN
ncbi:MAG TPA: ankyrin repeat domain-containing protein [Vicinamibacterales bacterium]|nr:ankyrin repeat domain-containing protein [Vicinamibacterales bacterium]